MKPSLQLRLGQQLTMTPQLQQAIRLLQLSSLDLQLEIQSVLDENPLLELDEDSFDNDETAIGLESHDSGPETSELGDDLNWEENALPGELPVDSEWEQSYTPSRNNNSNPLTSDYEAPESSREDSLQDHLLWQLNLTPMSATDRLIAEIIIDAIEANGMLGCEVTEILASVPPELEVEESEVLAVLHRLQHFEPAGVAARNLAECLIIQLRQLPPGTAWVTEAILVIDRYLSLLANHDFKALSRRSRLSPDQIQHTIRLIQSLDPHPGYQFSRQDSEYIIPDVIVRRRGSQWLVELNGETTPRLRINAHYASLLKRADQSADNQFIKNNLLEARWFLKSLQSRHETLLKVARGIMSFQHEFLERGEEAMKPLVLHEIAELVEMHESTISRVTTRKYALTPRGIFELKYFFSSHVPTSAGGECSSVAIRAIIKRLVAEEDARKPLSDSKLTTLLEQQGIEVARRTIAKYRESLGIAASNERKRKG